MDVISLADAKAQLSELTDRVEAGYSFVITRGSEPVALLTAPTKRRKFIDVAGLRAFTATLPPVSQSAADFVRSMRDGDGEFVEKLLARAGSIDRDVNLGS